MKRAVGIVLCCLVISFTFGQPPADSYELKTVIPPSPEAASLGKYGDIPVGYHTGVPNISIPLYELKEGDVKLPVSLLYHASGIRVAEVASWVGLGWTLNAGGVITRSVQHVPDEGPLPGKINVPPPPYFSGGGSYHTGYYRDGFTLPKGYENVERFEPNVPLPAYATYNKMLDAASGNSDTEPDLFFFNIGSYSGKFFFKVDVDTVNHTITRTPFFIPKSDVKIEVQYGNLSMPHYPSGVKTRETFIGFILTTPDGMRYYFGGANAIEYTGNQVFNQYNHNASVAVVLAPSSWYLTRIESPMGRHIDLEYVPDTFGFYDLAPERCWSGDEYLSLSGQMISRSVVNGVKLSRIYSGTEEILFKAETVREDLGNYENSGGGEEKDKVTTRQLDRIEINAIGGSPLRKFLFGYEYFRSPGNSLFPKFIEDLPSMKATFTTDMNRLRLDNLTETSGDGTISLPPYKFSYVDKDLMGVSEPLPRRMSFQQDHWGYYNHEVLNNGLISFWIAPRKNRRQTNDRYTQLGTLKSIKYPTGGITTFAYESHSSATPFDNVDHPDPGRNYVADSWASKGNGSFSTVSFATIIGAELPNPCLMSGVECSTFQNIILKFRTGSPTGGTYNLDHSAFNISPAIEIYRVGESKPMYRYDFGYLADCAAGETNCSIYNGGQPGQSFREINRTVSLQFPPGQYIAKTYRYEGVNADKSMYLFTAAFNILIAADRDPNYEPAITSELRKIGGLRIKSITTSDGCGVSPDQERIFTYPSSGGVLFSKPQYYYRIQYLFTNLDVPAIEGAMFQQLWSSNGILPMRTTQGNHIGYEWVKEQKGNGSKIFTYDVSEHPYHFNNEPYFKGNTYNYEAEGRRYNYPVYPAPMDLEKGNLLSEEDYDSNGKLVLSTRNTYESPVDVVITRASKVELLKAPISATTTWYVGYTHYPILTSSNRIKTTTVNSNYDVNGRNPASVITTYDYDGLGHLQATSVTKTMDDVEYVDKMIFPHDYGAMSSTAGGIKLLQAKNVINTPIEKYTIKRTAGKGSGLVIRGTLTQFRIDKPLPDVLYSFKLRKPLAEINFNKSNRIIGSFTPDASYEKRVTYNDYDAAGNPRDVSKSNNIHMAYLWGYSNTEPVAEIKNASISQVFHTSFEDQSANFSDSAFTGTKSWKGTYSVKPPGTGSFKLTYWKKTSMTSPWQLVETTIDKPTTVGETEGLIDEVRIYPVNSLITTYTYKIGVGVTTITDPNNLVTRYFYDALGRLICIKDHAGYVIKTFIYHYKNQ
ncbi:MAG: RHS repeat domain-containing protein [Bacteroidota bacterium]